MDTLRTYATKYWPVILLALLAIFTVLVMWFKPGYIIYFWDQTFPLNPPENLRSLFSIWHSEYAFGRADATAIAFIPYFFLVTVFSFLFQSLSAAQIVLYLLIVASSLIGMYFLVRQVLEIIHSKERYQEWKYQSIGIVASLLYVFNPYALFFEWRIVNSTIFLMALLPWIYFILLRHIRHPSLLNIVVFALLIFFASPGLSNPAFIPILAIIGVAFTVFAWQARAKIRHVLSLLLAAVLASCFWLVPVFMQLSSVEDAGSYGGVTTALIGNSQDLTMDNVMRLIGSSPISETYQGEPSYTWAQMYEDPFFTLLPFAALIVIFAGFAFIKIKHKKSIFIFLVLFLLLLFASKSINAPFQEVFWKAFEGVDFFKAYRDPFSKFGLGLVFAFVILFALISAELSKKLSRHVVVGLIVVPVAAATLVFNWPLVTGDVFRSEGPVRPSSYAKIPHEYSEVAAILAAEDTSKRAISLPMSTSPLMSSHWESGFVGFDPIRVMSVRPVISTYTGDMELEAYRYYLYELLQQPGDAAINAYKKLGIQWIIVRWDNNDAFDKTMSQEDLRSVMQRLKDNPNVDVRYDSDRISLLKLREDTTPKEARAVEEVAPAEQSVDEPVDYYSLGGDAITEPDNPLLGTIPTPFFRADVGDQNITAIPSEDSTIITIPARSEGSVISADGMDLTERYLGMSLTTSENAKTHVAFSRYDNGQFSVGGKAAVVGEYKHEDIVTELYDLSSLDFVPNRIHIHVASTNHESASSSLKNIFQTSPEGYDSIKGAAIPELHFSGKSNRKETHNTYAPWLGDSNGRYLAMDIKTAPGYSFFLSASQMVNEEYIRGEQLRAVYSQDHIINEKGLYESNEWSTYYYRIPDNENNYLNINVVGDLGSVKGSDAVKIKNMRFTAHGGGPEDILDYLSANAHSVVADIDPGSSHPYVNLPNKDGIASSNVTVKNTSLVGLAERFSTDWRLYAMPMKSSASCSLNGAEAAVCAHTASSLNKMGLELALPSTAELSAKHVHLNGIQNAWVVDPAHIRANYGTDYYTENPDGSITMNLVAYFQPQRYLNISLLVSGIVLFGCVTYVLWYAGKRILRSRRATIGRSI